MDSEAISPSFANIAINAFQRQQKVGNDPVKGQGASESNVSPIDEIRSKQQDSVELSNSVETEAGQQPSAQLDEQDKSVVQELKSRDQEVRTHEQAHRSTGGQYVRGSTSFTYERGPDGVNYAVGGEVQIDTSEVKDDPESTIRKMEQIRRAALAPKDPSPADRRVAAEASQTEAKARAELAEQRTEETKETSGGAEAQGVDGEDYLSRDNSETNYGDQNIINQFIDNTEVFSTPGAFLDLFA